MVPPAPSLAASGPTRSGGCDQNCAASLTPLEPPDVAPLSGEKRSPGGEKTDRNEQEIYQLLRIQQLFVDLLSQISSLWFSAHLIKTLIKYSGVLPAKGKKWQLFKKLLNLVSTTRLYL